MYPLLRPLLFRLDPERAHALTLKVLRLTGQLPPLRFAIQKIFTSPPKPITAFGLTFRNPVGLAAGYDKDGLAWRGLTALGFGHIEIGTVTPFPQVGNPKPRVFRLPEDRAVINRMGFPGRGAEFVKKNVQTFKRSSVRLGINIGKNKDTPNEEAARDYLTLFDQFAPLADYIAINVSSPNTVGLRRLQARDALEDLLSQLASARRTSRSAPPLLVKLSPDLTDEELDDALDAIIRTGMDGVIATNTTLRRDGPRGEGLHSSRARETGGVSGAPLTVQSTDIIAKIHQRTQGNLPVIGAGGILSPEDAKAKLNAGAMLVQVYTGLIYSGPGLVKKIVKSL